MNFSTKNPNLIKKIFLGGGEGVGVEGGRVHGRTDEQAQTNLPLQLLQVGGITMNKCTSYGPDKLNL